MEVINLCRAYGDRPVLENVSFTAGVGVTALWGPSGVGKTTLLRILLGLEKPDSGELMGTAVRWSAVFQEDRLLEGLDALGNLRFALGTDYEEAKAAAMLTALGLTWETGKPVREWSGGMKRRLLWPGRCWRYQTLWPWTSRSRDWMRKIAGGQHCASPPRQKPSRCFW